MKIVEKGNFDLFSQVLEEGGTYAEPVKKLSGLMSVTLDSSQETNNISADDQPDYYSSKGPLKLTGTIKMAGIALADYKDIFSVTEDKNQAIIVGGNTEVKKLGLAFKNRSSDGSFNMFTLNNCQLKLPPINTVSIDETGTTIREIDIPVEANPYEYTNSEGNPDKVTYSILNSVKNADIWESVKDKIYIPDSTVGV